MVVQSLNDEERTAFRALSRTIGVFRSEDSEMPVQQMLVFLYVATNEGCTQRDILTALEMASSTASRNIAALSPIHRLGKPGLGLITWVEAAEDRRAKLLFLTPKGRTFAGRLLAASGR